MNRQPRLVLAVALPLVVLLLVLVFPRIILQGFVLPAATALWLLLRTFVLSIDQDIYWWGMIAVTVFGAIVCFLRGTISRAASSLLVAGAMQDPVRRWRSSILLNADSEPSKDSFRRDLAWLLSSLFVSPHPGGAKYQVREALQERRIAIPPGVHDFLFASTRPRKPVPPLFADPRAFARAVGASLTETARAFRPKRRRTAEYIRSIDEALKFMEMQLEMTHELDPEE